MNFISATRDSIAAWLYAAVAVLVVVGVLLPGYPDWVTGLVAWIACLLLLPRLSRRQLLMVLVLSLLGVLGIAWGMVSGVDGLVINALTQNVPLAGMLVAVAFLQLIAVDRGAADTQQRGRGALLRTLIGVHLFGAVINYSAVAIFADRLSLRTRLSMEQAMGLSQAFIVGAAWSPFYGAMAAALTAAPEARLGQLILWGLPMAAVGILVTWFTLTSERHGGARDFSGYPLRLEALWVPALLAVGVLAVHDWQPQWSVLAIIAALAPLVTLATLLVRMPSGDAAAALVRHVHQRLPAMNGELTLFLAAGILSAGMTGMITVLDLALPFSRFGAFEAGLTLVVMNVCAWLGLHPVILVSVLGPWVMPLQPDHTLLAMVFLMSWGTGLAACPMSNTMLGMVGRYGLPFAELMAHNRRYGYQMTAAGIVVIYVYVWITTGG